jgi:predicted RNase H-like HicB family nuclease
MKPFLTWIAVTFGLGRVTLVERPMPEQSYTVETEQEADGRWIAEIPELPGVMAYGATPTEAVANVEAIALRVIADQVEQSKQGTSKVSFATA